MEKNKTSLFIKTGIFNLSLVAAIGMLMRYKIGFEFPFFIQKNLLHAHSHFAFAGWVSHLLYTLMVSFLEDNNISTNHLTKYIRLNLLCAYGMLISFTIQGYGPISILISTLCVLVGYVFSYEYYQLQKTIPTHDPSKNWFKAALLFNIISTLGTFYPAYMMVTKDVHQQLYLASIYFYLHFQYSGWFFFALMGLALSQLKTLPGFAYNNKLFTTFFWACIPAFFLSILWAKLPAYLQIIPVLAVLLQFWGLALFIILLKKQWAFLNESWSFYIRLLFGAALFALILKLLLQAGSIVPEISTLAFGFRSIVIAYLHLVLLGITTLFLLGFVLLNGYISHSKTSVYALVFFSIGVFLNEFILMVQGVASLGYHLVPFLNESLFAVSVFMFLNLIILLISNLPKSNKGVL